MKRNLLITTFVFLLSFGGKLFAQQNYTLYNMHRIPQSMYANPALTPMDGLHIGLPGLSSTYFNLSNNGFKAKDLLIVGKDDSLHLDPANMIRRLSKDNYLTTAVQEDILSFGFRVKRSFFSFSAIEKVLVRFRYPKDFMSFVWLGNGGADVIGKQLNFNFGLDATHYREYGVGYSLDLFDNLTFGVKLKYLYGMENISIKKSNISLYTDPNSFDITGKMDVLVNTSGLDSNAFNINKNYFVGKKNSGFGGDFGIGYKMNDVLAFSVSVVDIGYIKWNQGLANYRNKKPNASYTYSGLSFQDFISDSAKVDQAFTKTLDSITNTFEFETIHESYTTKLSPQIYLGATLNFTKKTFVGFLYHSQFFDAKYHPGFSFSFNTMAGRWLGFSTSYSIYNRSAMNFGMGMSLNLGPFQSYIVSDNIIGPIFPQSTKNINLRIGTNLTFGKPKEKTTAPKNINLFNVKPKVVDSDHDSIPDNIDECPDLFGLRQFNGCPDRDGDGVPDKNDDCPDVPGLAAFRGCPDTDGDGVEDRLDSCVTVAGLPQFNGCPDTDGDGVEDKLDSCLTIAGLKIFDGCPDTDGDGIPDKLDECPDKAGSLKFHGCPDTDGDGIPDKDDECPNQPGLATFMGCPDSDLDGVPDNLDDCPDTYGTKENKGCPLVKVTEQFASATVSLNEQEILKNAFDKLTFTSGKDIINPASTSSLDALSELMKANPALKLHVSGHTDNVGKEAANKKLSENRAKAVQTYLTKKGVNATQISSEGFGSTRPVALNTSPEGKAKNRRVELKFIK